MSKSKLIKEFRREKKSQSKIVIKITGLYYKMNVDGLLETFFKDNSARDIKYSLIKNKFFMNNNQD